MRDLLFNGHDVVLLLTAALALLLAGPMLMKRRSRVADRTLAGFVLTQGLAALYYLLVYSPAFGPAMLARMGTFEMLPLVVLYLLQGLFLLWYTYAITGHPVGMTRIDKRLFAAVMVLALFNAAVGAVLALEPTFPRIPMSLTTPAMLVSIIYGFRALRVLRRHDRTIRERFSNIEDINLLWLSYAAVGFTGVWLLRFVSFFAFDFAGQAWADALGAASNYPTIVLIAVMITLGLGQTPFPSALDSSESDQGGRSPRKPNPELVKKLERLMKDVRVYQDPDLDVEGLADSMGISPRSLSALINGHFGKNFYDFVNHYRVLEAQDRLRAPGDQDKTIQRIFEEAGFNSKSTFNTFFKKATGTTPSEYRQQALADPTRFGKARKRTGSLSG